MILCLFSSTTVVFRKVESKPRALKQKKAATIETTKRQKRSNAEEKRQSFSERRRTKSKKNGDRNLRAYLVNGRHQGLKMKNKNRKIKNKSNTGRAFLETFSFRIFLSTKNISISSSPPESRRSSTQRSRLAGTQADAVPGTFSSLVQRYPGEPPPSRTQ